MNVGELQLGGPINAKVVFTDDIWRITAHLKQFFRTDSLEDARKWLTTSILAPFHCDSCPLVLVVEFCLSLDVEAFQVALASDRAE